MLRDGPLVIRALNAGDYVIRQKKQFHYLLDSGAARAPVGFCSPTDVDMKHRLWRLFKCVSLNQVFDVHRGRCW